MSHRPTDSFSFFAEQDTYYPKSDQNVHQQFSQPPSLPPMQLLSDFEAPNSVQIPQTDFDPFYSDIVNLDSELDVNLVAMSDLILPEGMPHLTGNGTHGHLRQPSLRQLLSGRARAELPHSEPGQQPYIEFAPAQPIPKINPDLPSDPQAVSYAGTADQFDELPSSPPSSPQKAAWGSQPYSSPGKPPPLSFGQRLHSDLPEDHTSGNNYRRRYHTSERRGHRDSLGISNIFNHRPQSSVIVSTEQADHVAPQPLFAPSDAGNNYNAITPSGSPYHSLRSPYMAPPTQPNPASPYLQEAQNVRSRYHFPQRIPASEPPDLHEHYELPHSDIRTSNLHSSVIQDHHSIAASEPPQLPMPPQLPLSNYGIPDLSPALSDASLSPDPSSPEHISEFSWQPIVTLPQSDHSEAIIEQQRKPKLKRKSRLPDGVVDKYVGTTDTEHVYMCLYPNCNRLFKRTYNLRSHIQTHLCDRPYTCPLCHANFVRPHDLRRHERCHSTAKPFVCPCGKGFNRQDAMQRHRLREICVGGISSGTPKSPKPRGRPKGRRNTPSSTPDIAGTSPYGNSATIGESPARFEGIPAHLSKTPQLGSTTPRLGDETPDLSANHSVTPVMHLEPIPEGFSPKT